LQKFFGKRSGNVAIFAFLLAKTQLSEVCRDETKGGVNMELPKFSPCHSETALAVEESPPFEIGGSFTFGSG